MPSSSAALAGEFVPTPFRTHVTASGKPLESNEPVNVTNVKTDLSTLNNVPSSSKNLVHTVFASKVFKFVVVPMVTVAALAGLATGLAMNFTAHPTTSSSTQSMILTTVATNTTLSTTASSCSPSCVNGNCSSFNVCQCYTGWYGSTCSLPNCTVSCQNNGTCIAPNVCNCTSSYNGSYCQTPVCNPACQNGGTCVAPNICNCTNYWNGSVCQTFPGFFLPLDNSLQDLYNIYNGNSSSGIRYVSPGYNGAGTCLWLNASSSQSAMISTPVLNLVNASFTFEMWIYPQTLCTNTTCMDNDLISQYTQSSGDHALQLTIRLQKVFFGFYSDDATGNQTLTPGAWYHLAFVYDASVRTQYIYINGNLDVSRGSAGPYQGGNGSLIIGTGSIRTPNNFYDGCIDSIVYTSRVKATTEIFKDATLVASLSFDGNTLLDSGPLLINGTGANYSYTSAGRVNAALALSIASSYVQITGLVRLGTSSWPYSLAIWVYPTNSSGGTIMHMSSRTDGAQTSGWCLAMMGLSLTGQLIINGWNNSNVPVIGPVLPLNRWTHVVATYSPTNGERLYINGTLYSSNAAYNFASANTSMTVTLGSSLLGTGVCNSGGIQTGQFYGYLDQFNLCACEFSTTDVTALANP